MMELYRHSSIRLHGVDLYLNYKLHVLIITDHDQVIIHEYMKYVITELSSYCVDGHQNTLIL
jgi:hypothetical protein